MLDFVGMLFFIGSIAVPGLYVYVRGGTNIFIFVIANIGVVSLIGMAVDIIESVFHYLNNSYLPSFYQEGAPRVLWPIFSVIEWFDDYLTIINIFLAILNTIISPIIMYRYCFIFRPKTNA